AHLPHVASAPVWRPWRTAPSFRNSCLGTGLPETPFREGCEAVVHDVRETEFPGDAFPNRSLGTRVNEFTSSTSSSSNSCPRISAGPGGPGSPVPRMVLSPHDLGRMFHGDAQISVGEVDLHLGGLLVRLLAAPAVFPAAASARTARGSLGADDPNA